MPYSISNLPESELAYKVLREIAIKDKGDYGKSIAEKLDIKQQHASDIIQKLEKLGLIEEGVRERARYFQLDSIGIHNYFTEELHDRIFDKAPEDSEEDLVEHLETYKEEISKTSDKDLEEAWKKDASLFLNLYVIRYCERVESSTIKRMLFRDYFEGLERANLDEKPAWMDYLEKLGEYRYSLAEDPKDIVETTFISYQFHTDAFEEDFGDVDFTEEDEDST